jgi:hypothetical protein
MMSTQASTWRSGRTDAMGVRALLVCGVIAGPLFVSAFLVQGAIRPDYNPLRHSISTLALGSEVGWIQSLNFLVAGLLTLAFAVGVRRVLWPRKVSIWGPLLIGLWAVGLLGAGVFVTDPTAGYPPGTPAKTPDPSVHGILHDLSVLGFPALLAACVVFARWFTARGERGWALYSAVSGGVFVIAVVLASYGFPRTEGLGEFGGLFQRISVVFGWGWLTALATCLLFGRSAERAR